YGDDRLGLEPESLVVVNAARAAGALARKTSGREALGAAAGVQNLCECVCPSAMPDHPHRPQAGVSHLGLESSSVDLLSVGGRLALLTRRFEVGVRMLRSPTASRATLQNVR